MFGGKMPEKGWQTTPADRPPAYTGTLESLSDDLVLERWINGLVSRSATPSGFPHIPAPQTQTSSKTVASVGAAAALVAGLICGTLVWNMQARVSSMRAEIERLAGPADEKKRLDESIKETKSEMEELALEAEEATSKRDNLRLLVDQSNRFAVLLQALADEAESSIVLDSITSNPDGINLSGRAIRNEAATVLIRQLEPVLTQVGWAVRPPSVTGLNQTTAGGPWSFTIELTEQKPEAQQQIETVLSSVEKTSNTASKQKGKN
jgi:Tfp pilus assembly protein PilN